MSVGRAGQAQRLKVRLGKWARGPWGQMVVYLLIFLVLGFVVSAFFNWVRGPQRSSYTPWETGSGVYTSHR